MHTYPPDECGDAGAATGAGVAVVVVFADGGGGSGGGGRATGVAAVVGVVVDDGGTGGSGGVDDDDDDDDDKGVDGAGTAAAAAAAAAGATDPTVIVVAMIDTSDYQPPACDSGEFKALDYFIIGVRTLPSKRSVTLPQGHPSPQDFRALSHVNSSLLFIKKYMKSSIA